MTTEIRTVTTTQATKAIKVAFAIKRPLFIWGPPGIGKSEVIENITNEMGGFLIDMRLSQLDVTDLRGMPYYNKESNTMDWAAPIELPTEEFAAQFPVVVLFFDEMNSASPSVQAAAYQLVLNRKIGTYTLPKNVVIVAAGNRESDKGVTYRMPSPLSNRFMHLEMRQDFDSWEKWALDNNVHQDVLAYVTFAKQDLYDFDAKSASRAFATPRSWVFVSQILHEADLTEIDDDTLTNLISGTVGEGLAVKFMTHRKVVSKLPKAADILNGTVSTLQVRDISAQYSLVISMCYELKELKTKKTESKEMLEKCENFIKFMMDNFDTEIVVMGVRVALQNYNIDLPPTMKCLDEFQAKFGKYVIASNSI